MPEPEQWGRDADDMTAAIGLLAKSAAHAAHDRSSKCLSPKLTVSPPQRQLFLPRPDSSRW